MAEDTPDTNGDSPEPEDADVQTGEQTKKPAKAGKVLPTLRIGLPKQFDLLRAFGTLYSAHKRPIRPQEVAELVEMHRDTSRLANAFFLDAGLLQKTDAGYIPTQAVVNFHRAGEWGEEHPEHKLQLALRETWFARAVLTRLSFRGAVEESEALSELANAADAQPSHRSQLQLLLGYLETAGMVIRDGTMLRSVRAQAANEEQPVQATAVSTQETLAQPVPASVAMRTIDLPKCGGTLTLSGNFNPFQLADEERELVYAIIDKMNAFERGLHGEKK